MPDLLLPHDLHYSHKDNDVLTLFETNSIIPIFIPAGCTDIHQVCDVCINKTYNDWQSSRREDDEGIFKVNLSTGETKPLIPANVMLGIKSVKTPAIKESIAICFQKEGLLPEIYRR